MYENNFMTAQEVAEVLGISQSFAYKIIKKFNKELQDKGYFVIAGRLNRQYFLERTCYGYAKKGKEGD